MSHPTQNPATNNVFSDPMIAMLAKPAGILTAIAAVLALVAVFIPATV